VFCLTAGEVEDYSTDFSSMSEAAVTSSAPTTPFDESENDES
jgi:hypothetical protein